MYIKYMYIGMCVYTSPVHITQYIEGLARREHRTHFEVVTIDIVVNMLGTCDHSVGNY